MTSDECSKNYEMKTVIMEVYFSNSATIYIQEIPAFTFADMLSNLGGISGMLYGLSVVTGIEFLWILFEVMYTSVSGHLVGN